MKPRILILLLLVMNVLSSCSEEKKAATEDADVHFVIQGTVKNGYGKELALHIPSQNLDNRLVSPIENGKFMFEGSIPKPESATISFEEEHKNQDGNMSIYQVFLTNDTLKISAEVVEQYDILFLKNDTITKGEINQYFQSTKDAFNSAYSGAMSYRDGAKQDSVRENVYPGIRTKVLKKYEELFAAPEHGIIALSHLRNILEDNYIFKVEDLNESEKTTLIEHFERIPMSLEGTPDYTVAAAKVARLKNPESFTGFRDFSLPDENSREQKLSDIINQNEYTVLDFWWSGCRPCRIFNRKSQEDYAALREAGIEIIGINVDDGRENWERASKQDSLGWINLYAGANSRIQSDYNIYAFPAKVIVDRNFDIVDLEFKTAKELLALLSEE